MNELYIRDLVNNEDIDIRAFNASFLSYAVEDGEPTVTTYRYGQMLSTGYGRTDPQDATLTLKIQFTCRGFSECLDNFHKLIFHLMNCSLKFSQEHDKNYVCILKKYSHEFQNAKNMTATYELSCGKYGDENVIKLSKAETYINIGGALKTPINLSITAVDSSSTTTMPNLTIAGSIFSNVTFTNTLVINSEKRLILDNGSLATSISFTEFPEAIGPVLIDLNTFNAFDKYILKASYKERWI